MLKKKFKNVITHVQKCVSKNINTNQHIVLDIFLN